MPAIRRQLRWIAPVMVLALAALLRFWALGRPGTLVFDELYYVRDAISQLAHGYPTVWPDDDPSMAGARATAFSAVASNAVHPPLGKWLIGLGVLAFGADGAGSGTGWGWRSAVALAGVLTVAVTMRLGWLMSRSLWIACVAGLLLAVDGVHVVLTRVGLLDGFLALFIALGALLVWHDLEWTARRSGRHGANRRSGRILWWRPWLLAAGLAFSAAAAVKWSGLYPLAFFLIFVTVRDLLARLRSRGERAASPDPESHSLPDPESQSRLTAHPVLASIAQAGATALIALPAAASAYLASWIGWIANPGGYGREPGAPWPVSLAKYHGEMLSWHRTLSAPHPFQSHPLEWPLALRPTAMYEHRWNEGCAWTECVSGISPLPNPFVTWGGVVALVALAALAVIAARRTASPLALAAGFVITGYLSGWLPWVLTFSRSAVFQFYTVVLTPFSALALALVLGLLWGERIRSAATPVAVPGAIPRPMLDGSPEALRGRRVAVALFLAVAVLLGILFFPVWSGMPVADWFWQSHMWLPGWA
ncbi:MAG: phospholipid carrier-dependent glycosyltransferase [Leucobacter sp.]